MEAVVPTPPPLGDPAESRRALGIDDEQLYLRVIEEGSRRLDQGQQPVLPYKNVTDPIQAYMLARVESHIRTFMQVRPHGVKHLMDNIKYVGEDYYRVFLAPWNDAGRAAIRELQDFARWVHKAERRNILIEARMNGTVIRLNRRSNPENIRRDWLRALDGCTKGPIGPRVPHTLSEATLRNDHRIITEQAVKRALEEAAYSAKLEERQQQLDTALHGIPDMEIGDPVMEQKWQEVATDGDMKWVVTFGKTWARLMQAELIKGKLLEDVISPTYWLAHGKLPALFGTEYCAVLSYVAQTWAHAELFEQHKHLV